MTLSFWPPVIGLALLVINACYGAGFSVIPAILADHYGMTNISKIHGAVLSAWGFAGLAGNQAAIFVSCVVAAETADSTCCAYAQTHATDANTKDNFFMTINSINDFCRMRSPFCAFRFPLFAQGVRD